MITRRAMLSGTAAISAAGLAPPLTASCAKQLQGIGSTLPELGFLRDTPLVNADRARYFMQQEGLDALVVTHPANVFYLSNHWPQLDRMGFRDTAAVVFSRDPSKPLALTMHAFSYYYTVSPEDGFSGRAIYPYTSPAETDAEELAGNPPAASPARGFGVSNEALMTDLERSRAAALDGAQAASVSPAWALKKAISDLGLESSIIGYDAAVLVPALRSVGVNAELRPSENTLRRIRLAKSPAEIQLMKFASAANVQAGMAAAAATREFETARELRARFFSEAAARGNDGVFMVVNSSSSEVFDQPITDGMAFAIDCVSTCHFYHGDFGRTVFVGEPHKNMQRSCDAIATAWRDIQQELKPGLRFADVPLLGQASLKKQGVKLNVSFRPHSVGLFHTDQPQASMMEPGQAEALVLEENMIISVDCPVMEAGIGGTAHLEDLILIKSSGSEPIHEVPESIIIV